jgi:hypothetical protein
VKKLRCWPQWQLKPTVVHHFPAIRVIGNSGNIQGIVFIVLLQVPKQSVSDDGISHKLHEHNLLKRGNLNRININPARARTRLPSTLKQSIHMFFCRCLPEAYILSHGFVLWATPDKSILNQHWTLIVALFQQSTDSDTANIPEEIRSRNRRYYVRRKCDKKALRSKPR